MRLALAAALAVCVSAAAHAELPIRPDDRLTPGVVATTDVRKVCQPGFSRTVRHTTASMKAEVYRRYGIDPRSSRFEVDHREPLELGGADVIANLWPQSQLTQPWNGLRKDRLENRLHALVCSGRMRLEDAQAVFLGDWIAGYQRYVGN
jgi:hypothetical protein